MAAFFATARERAVTLADTADYADWPAVAKQLAKEGYGPRVIAGLGRDRAFKRELVSLIKLAEDRRAKELAEKKPAKRVSPAIPVHNLSRRR